MIGPIHEGNILSEEVNKYWSNKYRVEGSVCQDA